MSATALLEYSQYYGVPLEIKNIVFSISYLAAPRPTLTLNDMLIKNYMLKMMLLYPNLATTLITTLIYQASKA